MDTLTTEQQEVVSHGYPIDGGGQVERSLLLKVLSRAGTGKTKVIQLLAQRFGDAPSISMRLLAFNTKIVKSLTDTFAGKTKVEVSTFYSFSRALYFALMEHLNPQSSPYFDNNLRIQAPAKLILAAGKHLQGNSAKLFKSIRPKEYTTVYEISCTIVQDFCSMSVDEVGSYVQPEHLLGPLGNNARHEWKKKFVNKPFDSFAALLADVANHVYNRSVDSSDATVPACHLTAAKFMEVYLWSAEDDDVAEFDELNRVNFFLIDEAQDLDSSNISLLTRLLQRKNAICVMLGDSSQCIYSYKWVLLEEGGPVPFARDVILANIDKRHVTFRHCFRTSDSLTAVANAVVSLTMGLDEYPRNAIVGMAEHGTIVPRAEMVKQDNFVVLCRKNSGIDTFLLRHFRKFTVQELRDARVPIVDIVVPSKHFAIVNECLNLLALARLRKDEFNDHDTILYGAHNMVINTFVKNNDLLRDHPEWSDVEHAMKTDRATVYSKSRLALKYPRLAAAFKKAYATITDIDANVATKRVYIAHALLHALDIQPDYGDTPNKVVAPKTRPVGQQHIRLGTVHTVKGLQFENVLLYDDFTSVVTQRTNPDKGADKFILSRAANTVSELNVLYTAATRATHKLSICKVLADCISCALSRFHNAGMTHHVMGVYKAMGLKPARTLIVDTTSGESDDMPSSPSSESMHSVSSGTTASQNSITGSKRCASPVESMQPKQRRND